MKKAIFAVFLIAIQIVLIFGNSQTAKAYSNNNLISDQVFDNAGTMDTAGIQNFLNQFPNSCLKNYSAAYPNSYSSYGGAVSAATVIRRAADLWGLNPQVILAKLEQEESLVRGNAGCAGWRYNSAMGYACPDSTGCNPAYAGFSQQVTKGAFQLKFNKEVSVGNGNWQENGDIVYGGYMTQGTRKRCNTCASVYYDGYATIDGNLIHMDTGATASLYSYTPHVPSSFPGLFQTFFNYDPASNIGPSAANGVYRAYFSWNGEHFYSNSYAEIQNIVARGAQYEGVHFYAPPNQDTVPLYRFWVSGNFHFYTQDVGEYNAVSRTPGFRWEGIAWQVYRTQAPGTIPVYRLYKPANGDHLYTVSTSERDAAQSLGYRYEGVHFYNSPQ